jgi:glycosyltransferase involved in cell wall biosynthesis
VAHPSYREGLPRAVVQGLLSARPVVTYTLDGAPEVCIEGETGFLVTPGDHDTLRDAVLRLRQDPDLGATLGRAGRDRCRSAFDHRTMVRELDDLYRRVLDQREVRP